MKKLYSVFTYVAPVLLIAGVLFFWTVSVRAQERVGLKIQPSIIEEKVTPGKSFSTVVRVTNTGLQSATYYFLKRDISRIDDNGTPVYAQENEPTGFELSSWITAASDSVTVAGGETKEVGITIAVPADAAPGSHFGGIFLVSKAPKLRQTGTGVGYEVGTIISLRIAGDVLELADIRDFYADKLVYGKADVSFSATLVNKGNTIVRPRGPLTIINMFGKKVGVERLNDSAAAVLPGQNRNFTVSWKPTEFTFGRFEALLDVVYGDDGRKTISKATSFWVLPVGTIVPVVAGLLVLILGIYGGMRLHIKRKIAELSGGSVLPRNSSLRRSEPLSQLTVVTVAVLVFALLFMFVLLFFFA